MTSFDAKTKIWSGKKVSRDENNLTFREEVFECLSSNPEKVFQISDDEGIVLTYAQTKLMSIRVAQNLTRLGIGKGDVVTTFFSSSTFVAPIVFGSVFVGAPINALIYGKSVTIEWLQEHFIETQTKMIIVENGLEIVEPLVKGFKENKIDCKIFLVKPDNEIQIKGVHSYSELLNETGNEMNFKFDMNDGINNDSITFILPSSGTTGPPKGVAMSGRFVHGMKYLWDVRADSVIFSFSTLNWITGLGCLFFPLLNLGARIITKAPFSPKTYGYILKKYKVTSTLIASRSAIVMFKSADFNPDDFSAIKEMICGGERLPSTVRNFLVPLLPKTCFTPVLGISEMNTVSSFIKDVDLSKISDNIVGGVRENGHCKIVDVDTREALGPNKVGEILLKSEFMFSGYYKDPNKTEEAFEDGWFKTSDAGYFDENNFLHLHGRVSDMFTFNGVKIHPSLIESAVENFEGVQSACALVVSENVIAVLCTKLPSYELTDEILTLKAKTIVPKVTGGIFVVNEIPRKFTGNGKISRIDAKNLAIKLMKEKLLIRF